MLSVCEVEGLPVINFTCLRRLWSVSFLHFTYHSSFPSIDIINLLVHYTLEWRTKILFTFVLGVYIRTWPSMKVILVDLPLHSVVPTELQGDFTDIRPWSKNTFLFVRLEVLPSVTINNAVIWDVTQCSLVQIHQHFERMHVDWLTLWPRNQAVWYSETMVFF